MKYFITFEGVEFSGKSTQVKKVASFLRREGFEVVEVYEPGFTKLGEKIRDLLLHCRNISLSALAELFLFEAARAQLVIEVIKPALDEGRVVVCDRFTDSTLAYQVYGRGLKRELVEELNKIATQNLEPDLTFYLRAPLEEILKKRQIKESLDRFEKESFEFHRRVEAGYESLAKEFPERIVVIDYGSVEEVFRQLAAVLREKLIEKQLR